MHLFMKSLFGSYSQAINKQQSRQGPLFQGRYRAIWVDEEEYLMHLPGEGNTGLVEVFRTKLKKGR